MEIISSFEYISKIKNNKFSMGDIEIAAGHIVYAATLLLLELNSKNELTLLQTYGNINNNIKYLLI